MQKSSDLKTSFHRRLSKEEFSLIVTTNTDVILRIPDYKKRDYLFKWSLFYTFFISLIVIASLMTMIVSIEEQQTMAGLYFGLELVFFIVLMSDFILRWITAEYRIKKGKLSFWFYPISFSAIFLLVGISGSSYVIGLFWSGQLSQTWEVLEILKFARIYRLFMFGSMVPLLKVFRLVITKSQRHLTIILLFVIMIIVLFAFPIYASETSIWATSVPEDWPRIHTYWDAVYYCTIAITTIGFGDIIVISNMAKILTVFMAFIGVSVLAIPAGILASAFIIENRNLRKADAIWKKSHEYLLLQTSKIEKAKNKKRKK